MGKTIKKILCAVIVVVMCIISLPFVGLDFKAEATEYKVGDIIQFGSYPQSEVKDSVLIRKLNALVPNWENWVDYGYYIDNPDSYSSIETLKSDTMRYIDIAYKGEKYRAVKFTEWRHCGFFTSSAQSNNGYRPDNIYWFKYEPINWRIIDPINGLCLSESIIDARVYSDSIYLKRDGQYNRYNDSSYTNYASDYETSSIRKWLNDCFYNDAFSVNEKAKINLTKLNNDCCPTLFGYTGHRAYDSNSTEDQVFLLSFDEVNNNNFGFSINYNETDINRTSTGTDYSKVHGLSVSKDGKSAWYLRSPGCYSFCCGTVMPGGTVECIGGPFSSDPRPHCPPTDVCGIRPTIRIKLENNSNGDNTIVFDNGNDYYIYTGSSMLLHDENNFKISGLSAKMYSDNLTYEDVEWSCSDESILKITDSGGFYYREKGYHVLTLDVKALKLGTVTLTATASDGTTESCTVTVKGEDCYLEVESVNSSNSIPVDEILPLWVALYKNGKQTYEEKTFNLSFDNPGIFDVVFSNSNTNSEGAYFTLELKAKKEGVTNLTISDSETGAYITVLLTATPKMNVYYFNNVPSKEYQKGRQTNFYNYNGLCIDYFNYTQQNGYYYVNMNAYNSKHHYGVAVSYNSIGEIHDFEILEPYKEYKTTLTENIAELGYSIYDLGKLFGDKYYYTGDSISKHTHVQLEVPQNGYVVITNNCSENELAYLVNMIEYTTNVALSTVSASIGMSEKSALIKDLSKSIVKDLIESGLIQVVQTYASSLSKNISYKNINLNVAEFTEAMKKLDLDIVKIVTDAINLEFGISLAESVLWNILPTGKVIEMMFAFNDAQNIVAQADDFSKSYNAPLIVIYPPLNDDDAYTSNGVVVNPETELSPEYVLHSYIVAENNQVAIEADKVLNGLSEQYKLYNITLYKGGKEAQPNGKIKVMIPIPVGYDRNNIMVYWYKEDGTIESVSAKVEGDYATFVTEHLSYYALVEHSHTFDGSKCTFCGYDKADECDCNCHASGIKKFFFNFILFFQKLFKKNAVCDCGMAHY